MEGGRDRWERRGWSENIEKAWKELKEREGMKIYREREREREVFRERQYKLIG